MDLRCENGIKFAVLEDGVLEFKCRSRRCGSQPGVVVLHRFSAFTGEDLGTRRFREPGARLTEGDTAWQEPQRPSPTASER